MKIRTDFVTNSSSSSFIFKETDKEKIKMAVKKQMSISLKNEEEEEYEYINAAATSMEGQPFDSFKIYDLMETYHWYRDDLLSEILGMDCRENWYSYDGWKQLAETAEKILSDCSSLEKNKKITAFFILDLCENSIWRESSEIGEDVNEMTARDFIFDRTFLDNEIWEYMASCNMEANILFDYYMRHIEKMADDARVYDGKNLGEIMADLFGAKALYLDDLDTDYRIVEIMKEAGICKYACGHMG